jgi:hypothetical protein
MGRESATSTVPAFPDYHIILIAILNNFDTFEITFYVLKCERLEIFTLVKHRKYCSEYGANAGEPSQMCSYNFPNRKLGCCHAATGN